MTLKPAETIVQTIVDPDSNVFQTQYTYFRHQHLDTQRIRAHFNIYASKKKGIWGAN